MTYMCAESLRPSWTAHVRSRTLDGQVRPVLWRELLPGLALFAVYSLVAGTGSSARRAAAASHARDLFHVEQVTHVDIERSLNTWLLHQNVLRVIADYEYAFTYIISAMLLLIWLYLRQPQLYRWARTWFVVLNLIGMATFVSYPVTPPRMMPSFGFVDTVTQGHTFGSWGSGAVDHANTLAAMPSLHLAWALWVSVVLGIVAGAVRTQLVSFVHVVVTLFVIMATANHYLLDAVGGAVCVMVSLPIAAMITPRNSREASRSRRVAAADAFFLYVESVTAPQHVGGLLLLDAAGTPDDPGHPGRPGSPTRDELETVVRGEIEHLRRFRQRLSPFSRWRRPRWVDVDDIDWAWHVAEHDVSTPTGEPAGVAALNAYVAELQATPLPRDRPLWRLVAVRGFSTHETAAVFIAHHVIADGFGTVAHAVRLLKPPSPPAGPVPVVVPGRSKRFVATATGLAQLATDGRPKERIAVSETAERVFGTVTLPFDDVRGVARALGSRVTDVVLCLVAGGLSRVIDRRTSPEVEQLRASVPLLVPRGSRAVEGNTTGAAMIDLPLGDGPEASRLAAIAARSGRLNSGTRALASRFVMDAVGEVLPPIAHAWFARTVYGRRFFQAIVSNIPGPVVRLSLAGLPLERGYPILPLAPGAPIAVGALTVTGQLGIAISANPGLVPDIAELEAALLAVYDDLRGSAAEAQPSPRAAVRR